MLCGGLKGEDHEGRNRLIAPQLLALCQPLTVIAYATYKVASPRKHANGMSREAKCIVVCRRHYRGFYRSRSLGTIRHRPMQLPVVYPILATMEVFTLHSG